MYNTLQFYASAFYSNFNFETLRPRRSHLFCSMGLGGMHWNEQ